jgi:glycine cleavage system H protein
MVPRDLKYTKEHEWVRMEGTEAVLGITDHAQKALGDITYIELPRVGRKVDQNESVSVVESVKAASDVFSPLAGTVAGVNAALEHTPEDINRDPYGEGWIFRLKDFDAAGLAALMSAQDYEKLVAGKD